MLKSYRVVVVVVAHEILVSAQGPLVLGFWVWGLGVRGQGLTIKVLMMFNCLLINWPRVNRTRWFWGPRCSWGLHRGARTRGPEDYRYPAYWWWTCGWTGLRPSACWPALQIVPKCSSLRKWLQPEQTGGLIFHHQHNSSKYTKLKMSLIIKLTNLNNFFCKHRI